MANREHLKVLKQGVEVWNEWRAEHPEITPDLSEAEVCKARLIGANLKAAELGGAELDDADLGGLISKALPYMAHTFNERS